jgi:hypothetical protein
MSTHNFNLFAAAVMPRIMLFLRCIDTKYVLLQ